MDSVGQNSFENRPLKVTSLPRFEEVALERLEPNYLLKRNISSSISLLFFLAVLGGGYFFVPDAFIGYFLLVAVVGFLLFAWGYVVNYQLYRRNGYGLRERDIIFKHGFLSEKTTVIPFNRVQHVSTTRSLLDKFLGLSTLKVFTAGGSGSDISIPGLLPKTAGALKEALAERMFVHV